MGFDDLQIISQLEADMNELGDSECSNYAKNNIKAAMRGIEDANYRFACDRLAIAIGHILSKDGREPFWQ